MHDSVIADMAPRASPEPMPEQEANSGHSHDEGEGDSSGDETAPNNASGETPRKRKRAKYEKTSYVVPGPSLGRVLHHRLLG